jgi:hypothetical protein
MCTLPDWNVLPEYDTLSHLDPLAVAVPAVCDKLPPLPNENPSVRFTVTDIEPLMLTVIPAEAVELLQVVRVPVVDVAVVLLDSLYVFVSEGSKTRSPAGRPASPSRHPSIVPALHLVAILDLVAIRVGAAVRASCRRPRRPIR